MPKIRVKTPANKKRSVLIHVKITPPEQKRFLKLLKESTHIYSSALASKIIVDYIDAHAKEQL